MRLEYSSAFKRSLRKLSRRYRSLRNDLQPLIDALAEGTTPGDRLQNSDYAVYKVRVKNALANGHDEIYFAARYRFKIISKSTR